MRAYLVKEAFNILKVSPAIGKTVRLDEIIGMTYSHNFTLQVLVETGLIGMTVYLSVFGAVMVKWIRSLADKSSSLFPIGGPLFLLFLVVILEAHAHGSIMNPALWMCYGLMAGHSIRAVAHEPAAEEWPDELEATWAPGY